MKLISIIENQKAEYQSFVAANGCFLQDWDWGEFQRALGRKIVRLGLVENEKLILTAQVIFNEYRNKKYLYIPYGPVQESSGDAKATLLEFLAELARKYPDCIFFRLEPQLPLEINQKRFHQKRFRRSVGLNPHQTLILDLAKDSETLLKEMYPKTRYNIKVAIKRGVQVSTAVQFSDPVKEIFYQTSSRAGIRFQQNQYFSELLKFFADGKNISARLYLANLEEKVLAVNLMIFWNKTAIYLFGGSSSENRNAMAPYLLHWQAIQDAQQAGREKYDFWGVEENPNHPWFGFSRFKLGFGGKIVKYSGTIDYVLHPAWYNAYALFRKLNRIVRK